MSDRVMSELELAGIEYARVIHGVHHIERACLDEAFLRGAAWAYEHPTANPRDITQRDAARSGPPRGGDRDRTEVSD